MRSRIYVSRKALKECLRGKKSPPIVVRDWRGTRRGCSVVIRSEDGKVLARFVFGEQPLRHGTRVWCETRLTVEVE